ncbi:MAG: extracellular solute-binding protein, partial [Anaerolineae bacterium]|nr:extracellular solute-binding protein [Anaerolineae bacterium]
MKTRGALLAGVILLLGTVVQAQRQRLTVLWMHSPADREMFEDLLDVLVNDFETIRPEVDIEFELVDWAEGQQTIKQAVSRGTPPDMAVIGARWVPEFVSLGIIEPLDRYMNAQFRGQFISTLINEGSVYQGRVFGLPIATSTRALFYNRDLFEQAGITDPPQTWSDLRAAAEAITALPGEAYGFGLQGGGGLETNTYFYYFVWGNGGDIYDRTRSASALNSPQAVEALAFVRGLIDDGL